MGEFSHIYPAINMQEIKGVLQNFLQIYVKNKKIAFLICMEHENLSFTLRFPEDDLFISKQEVCIII